jgi:hypothetical protein
MVAPPIEQDAQSLEASHITQGCFQRVGISCARTPAVAPVRSCLKDARQRAATTILKEYYVLF